MTRSDYTLMLVAAPGGWDKYEIGPDAGDVEKHQSESEKKGKIFWYCAMQPGRGVFEEDRDDFKEMMSKISIDEFPIGKRYRQIKLNDFGFIYDAHRSQVAWRFDLERILHGTYFDDVKGMYSKYRSYFSFRNEYRKYDEDEHFNNYWFLLSNIEELDDPVDRRQKFHGMYTLPGFKYEDRALLTPSHLRWGSVFVTEYP